ncbi:26S proteasome non-ATPase regulatory subunit, partial [Cladochytrium tenue]
MVDDATTATPAASPEEDAKWTLAEIRQNIALVDRAIAAGELRFSARAIRSAATVRRRLSSSILLGVVTEHIPKGACIVRADVSLESTPLAFDLVTNNTVHTYFCGCKLESNTMEIDKPAEGAPAVTTVTPEVELYCGFLVLLLLYDIAQYEKVHNTLYSGPERPAITSVLSLRSCQGIALSDFLVREVQRLNRRSLDPIASKIYFYYSCFYENAGQLADIRPTLLTAQRTAVLRHDAESQ